MNVQDISIQNYLYDLPEDRIAKYPLNERDSSRLLVYRAGSIEDRQFADLASELPSGAVLVRNNSRVIHARLIFRKESGAQVEIFCLTPLEPTNYELALGSRSGCSWHCMLGNARRWRVGDGLTREIELENGQILRLCAERVGQAEVAFSWEDESHTFGELLDFMGILPIPPYLNRPAEASDASTYQTVYARTEGSVAAPTAGLHFTPHVFDKLKARGLDVLDITLHVGAGTFRPVKTASLGEHDMHEELVLLDRQTIQRVKESLGQIVAIGTTSVRSLESLYHLGSALHSGSITKALSVTQWQPYEKDDPCSTEEALEAVLDYMTEKELEIISFPTSILIAPGYKFRLVTGIITNFHQPHSTLLLLIAAFVGEDWRCIYNYALAHDYRFLSYGDSSLLLP